jgi:4-amino-4-deoxy-L-arabinose transferase-like glycosyltransferase
MSEPVPPIAASEPRSSLRIFVGVILLALAYLLPGLVGHDPWKQDEAYSFGIIYNMYRTGDFVVPTLAADPFMEKPPAYYISATGMVHLLHRWLPLHDAARLTTAMYLCLALVFTGLLTRATWGRGYGVLGVLLLLSTLGLLQNAHFMITDTALAAGVAIGLYGLVRARESIAWGGLWLGTGAGLAFLSKGLLGPGVLGLTGLTLPAVFGPWRSLVYLKALLVAMAVSLPWLLIWPTALYLRDPSLFTLWFWDNNFGRYIGTAGLGSPARDLFWLRTFPWVTFPVLPVALWTLWRRRADASASDGVRVMLVASIIGWAVLFASNTARDLYALPLLAPLAVIGAGAIRRLPAWVVAGGYWGSAILFGLLAGLLWFLWLHGLAVGHAPELGLIGKHLPPDFQPAWRWGAFLGALVLQIGWTWVLVHFRPPQPAALVIWPAGLTLVWGLVATIHLPWLDQAKSYRTVFTELKHALPAHYRCVADLKDMRLRESERGMLHYFAGVTTEHIKRPQDTDCDLIVVETPVRVHGTEVDLGRNWRRIWEGRRRDDRRDLFILFQRIRTAG